MRNGKRLAVSAIWAILLAGCGYQLVRHGELNQPYFEAIKQRVSAERGLNWVEPVKVEIINRERVYALLEEELNKEYPPQKIEALQRAYVRIGLIDPGTDLREALLKFLTGATAGFYNPEKKTLFIVKEVAGHASLTGIITRRDKSAELIIAHELTHALDDQHFDLEKMDNAITDNDDAALALSALEEGTATIVGFAVLYRPQITMDNLFALVFRFNELNTKITGILTPGTPASVRDMLLFSYDAGSRFVATLYRSGAGWDAVNKAYKNPPHSTEQVLHPDKYLAGNKNPIMPEIPISAKSMGEGWTEIERNTMGEFSIESLFRRFLTEKEAVAASQGWAGDRYLVIEGPGKSPVIWVWRAFWNSEEDAKRFAEAYIKILPKKYPKLAPLPNSGDLASLWDTGDGLVSLTIKGKEVAIIEGADTAQTDTIRNKLHESAPAGYIFESIPYAYLQ